jgi:hypothetical protein
MSDEQQRQHEQVQVAPPEQPKNAWGDPISDERQSELLGMLDAWNTLGADNRESKGPFYGVPLKGADVSWLAKRAHDRGAFVFLHLETLRHMESFE